MGVHRVTSVARGLPGASSNAQVPRWLQRNPDLPVGARSIIEVCLDRASGLRSPIFRKMRML
jgi:hypothetical protein